MLAPGGADVVEDGAEVVLESELVELTGVATSAPAAELPAAPAAAVRWPSRP